MCEFVLLWATEDQKARDVFVLFLFYCFHIIIIATNFINTDSFSFIVLILIVAVTYQSEVDRTCEMMCDVRKRIQP